MAGNKILVVEDDRTLLDVLKYNLNKEGYTTLTASDGLDALKIARREKPELLILDVMIPSMNGFEVCRILRQESTLPILMLTAKIDEVDKVVGLEIGADDYMTKPFSMRELLARVRAMLRRSQMVKPETSIDLETTIPVLKTGNIEIDISRHIARRNGITLELSPKEFDLLVFLTRNHGQVFNRETLLEKVWGYDFAGDTRTVDVHMRWLRQKIETDPENPIHFITIRGVGYKFEEQP